MSTPQFFTIHTICEAKSMDVSIQNYCNYSETDENLQHLNQTLNKYISQYNRLITLLYEEKLNHSSSKKKQNELIRQINILNKNLKQLLNDIKERIEKVNATNMSIQSNVNEIKNKLDHNKNTYDNQIHTVLNETPNVIAQYQDRKLRKISEKYTFFAWLLLSFTILAITIHSASSNDKSIYEKTVVLIFCLLCVYWVAKWIYHKL